MKNFEKIEDVYPLTITAMRYGGFAIVEGLPCYVCVSSLAENEEVHYDPHKFMNEEWEHVNYGIGKTILEAFEDFKRRYKENITVK